MVRAKAKFSKWALIIGLSTAALFQHVARLEAKTEETDLVLSTALAN